MKRMIVFVLLFIFLIGCTKVDLAAKEAPVVKEKAVNETAKTPEQVKQDTLQKIEVQDFGEVA